ncbi:MAG: nucleotidyltransferase domain-containing protein [Verrucomicrobiales bacterium]
MPQAHIERVIAHAAEKLIPLRRKAKNREELLLSYRRFIKLENHRLRLLHRQGGGGVEVAEKRAQLLDVVINDLLGAYREGAFSAKNAEDTAPLPQVALVACGGYGRGVLNPGSDIDLLFLVGKEISDTPAVLQDLVETLLYMMMDVGFKVSQSVRTVSDSLTFANEDHPTKTALLDARFVAGNVDIFEEFQSQFFQRCVEGREQDYLGERSRDIRSRHQKFGHTVHLQEPNVKEGCGGLRDFHNIIWILWVLRRTRDLNAVVTEKLLGLSSVKAMENAYEFLMRVRNSLHYLQKKQGDILTLRLQGQVAED